MESVNFDRAAGYYDATRALPAEAVAAMTDLLAGEVGGRQPCLEIGVGTGRIALPLRSRRIELAGADISGAMLRQLLANASASSDLLMPVLQADATLLPFAARSFGSVLAVHVLHLIPDWRIAVDEAVRVLRPGGALVASFPTDNRAPAEGDTAEGDTAQGDTAQGDTAQGDTAQGDTARSDAGHGTDHGPDHGTDAAAIGLTRDRRAPWADAVRESARRRGMVRLQVGARDPRSVAAYLDGRASARQLAPVPVRSVTTLGAAIDYIERQLFSWTWPYTAEQAAAVAADVRDWASAAHVALDTAHESRSAVRWWVFELSS